MRILTGSLLALCLIATAMGKPADDNVAIQAVSQSVNQFSSTFFQNVVEKKQGNLITSPLSAAFVLSMAAYGARGETERQMKSVLHLGSDDAVAKAGFQSLTDILNNIQGVELRAANKVFSNAKFTVKPDYKALTETYYRSTSQSVNFGNAVEAARIINSWVESQTNNRIKDIVASDGLSDLTALVLVNAVYFKGNWKVKFDPRNTKNRPFHVDENTTKDVPTMFKSDTLKYAVLPSLKAKLIQLPYVNEDVSMVIILPDEINGLQELERNLQNVKIGDLLKEAHEQEVQLYVPKFKVESEIDLKDVLEKMGMNLMFTDSADFSGIADAPLKVDKVVQKAFVEVNEEGSEAAAATAVEFVFLSALEEDEPPVVMRVDRPFRYIIVKTSPKVILFDGHIHEPTTSG